MECPWQPGANGLLRAPTQCSRCKGCKLWVEPTDHAEAAEEKEEAATQVKQLEGELRPTGEQLMRHRMCGGSSSPIPSGQQLSAAR